jgi:hypothetical protein
MSIQLENISVQQDGSIGPKVFVPGPLDNLHDAFDHVLETRKLMERGLKSEAEWLSAMAAYSSAFDKAYELGLINVLNNR